MARTVDQEADLCAIGIILTEGQRNGLGVQITVAGAAVGQKTVIGIGPQVRIERLDALRRSRLHDGLPAARQSALKQFRQHAFQRAVLQVVEQHFGGLFRGHRSTVREAAILAQIYAIVRGAWQLE